MLLGLVLAFCGGIACCGLWAGAKVSEANARALDACTACGNWRNRYQQMREAFDTLCTMMKEADLLMARPRGESTDIYWFGSEKSLRRVIELLVPDATLAQREACLREIIRNTEEGPGRTPADAQPETKEADGG
jgi:hypothetical protein